MPRGSMEQGARPTGADFRAQYPGKVIRVRHDVRTVRRLGDSNVTPPSAGEACSSGIEKLRAQLSCGVRSEGKPDLLQQLALVATPRNPDPVVVFPKVAPTRRWCFDMPPTLGAWKREVRERATVVCSPGVGAGTRVDRGLLRLD